jgi:hypothetical protein
MPSSKLDKIKEIMAEPDGSHDRSEAYDVPPGWRRLYCGCGRWIDAQPTMLKVLEERHTSIQCPECFHFYIRFNMEA